LHIRIAGFLKESVVDGPGIRAVLFTQGCPHRCIGCHNPQTHDPEGGYDITIDELVKDIRPNRLLRGITLSGGEPLLQPAGLLLLAEQVKILGLDIMMYTGFTFEQVLQMAEKEPVIKSLLKYIDILVDGPFVEAQRDPRLLFRGSRNQRLIDVQKTMTAQQIVLWNQQEKHLA
jgi:anaerobic ribonucleoside-triphosphate reductase activating protein